MHVFYISRVVLVFTHNTVPNSFRCVPSFVYFSNIKFFVYASSIHNRRRIHNWHTIVALRMPSREEMWQITPVQPFVSLGPLPISQTLFFSTVSGIYKLPFFKISGSGTTTQHEVSVAFLFRMSTNTFLLMMRHRYNVSDPFESSVVLWIKKCTISLSLSLTHSHT